MSKPEGDSCNLLIKVPPGHEAVVGSLTKQSLDHEKDRKNIERRSDIRKAIGDGFLIQRAYGGHDDLMLWISIDRKEAIPRIQVLPGYQEKDTPIMIKLQDTQEEIVGIKIWFPKSEEDGTKKDGTKKKGTNKDDTKKDGTKKKGTKKDDTKKDGTQEKGSKKDGTKKDGTQEKGTKKDGTHPIPPGHRDIFPL